MVKESNSMWGDYWSNGTVTGKESNYIEVTYSREYHPEWEKLLYRHYRNTMKERFYFFGNNTTDRISTNILN